MNDSTSVPLDQLESGHSLPPDHQAECLLSVIAPLLQALQDAQSGSVNSTLQLYAAKQAFRECVDFQCRSLSVQETQDLLLLTVMSLCERIVDSDTSRQF